MTVRNSNHGREALHGSTITSTSTGTTATTAAAADPPTILVPGHAADAQPLTEKALIATASCTAGSSGGLPCEEGISSGGTTDSSGEEEEDDANSSSSSSSSNDLSGTAAAGAAAATPTTGALSAFVAIVSRARALISSGGSPTVVPRGCPTSPWGSPHTRPHHRRPLRRRPAAATAATMTVIDEVRAGLASVPAPAHPFLDLREQREAIEVSRHHRHVDYCMTMARLAALGPADQNVAARVLCHEAHRLQARRAVTHNARYGFDRDGRAVVEEGAGEGFKSTATASFSAAGNSWSAVQARTATRDAPALKDVPEIHQQWGRIATLVAMDLAAEGFGFVQRRLSCMCVFNSLSDDRPYCDNEGNRDARQQRQLEILMRLDRQQLLGGDPFFLEGGV